MPLLLLSDGSFNNSDARLGELVAGVCCRLVLVKFVTEYELVIFDDDLNRLKPDRPDLLLSDDGIDDAFTRITLKINFR